MGQRRSSVASHAKKINTDSNNIRKIICTKKMKQLKKPETYNPLDDIIAVGKVKERKYMETYLDPNNKIKLVASGKKPLNVLKEMQNDKIEDTGSSQAGESMSVKDRLSKLKSKYVSDVEEKIPQSKYKKSSQRDKSEMQNSKEKSKECRKKRNSDPLKSDSDSETEEYFKKKYKRIRKFYPKELNECPETTSKSKISKVDKNSVLAPEKGKCSVLNRLF